MAGGVAFRGMVISIGIGVVRATSHLGGIVGKLIKLSKTNFLWNVLQLISCDFQQKCQKLSFEWPVRYSSSNPITSEIS